MSKDPKRKSLAAWRPAVMSYDIQAEPIAHRSSLAENEHTACKPGCRAAIAVFVDLHSPLFCNILCLVQRPQVTSLAS